MTAHVPVPTVLHPAALWLLPAILLLFWWIGRRRVAPRHLVLRCVLVGCAGLALAQPGLSWRVGRGHRVFVLDQKDALTPAARARARAILTERLARLPAGETATLVQLGGAPVAARVAERIVVPGASLSAALGEAAAAIPAGAGGAVTVISDGRSSDRHWGAAVDALVRRGIAVDGVALAPPVSAPVLAELRVDPARAGETMTAFATVEGRGAGGSIALSLDGRAIASAPVPAVDGSATVPIAFTAPAEGFHRLRAELSGRSGPGTRAGTIAAVQPPLRLLYLGQRPAAADTSLQRLLGEGVAVEARDPAQLPAGFDFAAFGAVMLDDVPAAQLASAQQRRLLAAVADAGTGLFYSGGAAAFDRGGWDRAPLAAALPLTLQQQQRIETPSVALVVVIDSSGSMGGTALDLAKETAVLAARKLRPQDSIGVVEFYGAKQWALPVQPARDIAAIERAIGHMQAQGSSVLFPAIQEAYYGIKDVPARFKHILVISDGDVTDGTFEQLVRHIAAQGITLSTAVINGNDAGVARMMDWARWGRGRSFVINDDTGLVQIDLSPPQTKPEPGYRATPAPVRGVPGAFAAGGAGIGDLPPVAGHARVGHRDGTTTLLTAGEGDPLLTTWQYGAGRVTALMTEPLGPGSRGWAAWPRYGEWLGRTIAATARQSTGITASLSRTFDRMTVTIQRVGGAGSARPQATIADATGRLTRRVVAEEKAPGLFVADLRWPADRDALLHAVDGGDTVRVADRARSDIESAPLSARGALPLAALAQRTGGVMLADGSARASAIRGGDAAFVALWPWLALLALALYLFEIAYRRWPGRA